MTTPVEQTLAERGNRYGEFLDNALTAQCLKTVMAESENWQDLAADMREALEMIAHKIARILNGDPTYTDSWHDIAGYAQLVERRLRSQTTPH